MSDRKVHRCIFCGAVNGLVPGYYRPDSWRCSNLPACRDRAESRKLSDEALVMRVRSHQR